MRFQTVVGGDTLTGIAQQAYGDASLFPLIAAANGIKDPNRIDVDQVLRIPDLRLDLPVEPFVAEFDGDG
jgi:nucleoid-associated protein YgaU